MGTMANIKDLKQTETKKYTITREFILVVDGNFCANYDYLDRCPQYYEISYHMGDRTEMCKLFESKLYGDIHGKNIRRCDACLKITGE